jgi:hypothetical protein
VRRLSILVAVAIAAPVTAAQIQTCTISGTVYQSNGQPFVGAKIVVHRVRAGSQSGPLLSAVPQTHLTNSQGAFSFLLPRDSWAWIEAPIEGLFIAGGVPVYIPNAGSAELRTLPSNVKLPQQVPVAILTPQSVLDPGAGGLMVRTTLNVTIPRSIAVGSNLSITNPSGVDGNPTINLGANVVTSVVNDTNVTGSISANALTLVWAGTLAKARQHSTTVYSDQGNTFSAGAQDFSSAASLKVPIGAGAAPTISGLIAFNSSDNLYKAGVNGVGKSFLFTDGNGSALTNLDAGSLGSGIVPLARLSGITTTQLSASAGITNSQLANTTLNFSTLTNNGVLIGKGTSPIEAIAAGGVNAVLTTNAGVPVFSPTPTLDRLTTSPSTPAFDLASGVLGVGQHLPFPSTVSVATGKVFDLVRGSKTSGDYNVFDLAGTATASGFNFQLQAESTSGASSALYGLVGGMSNEGPGSAKAIYGRARAESGSTGTVIAGTFAVESISGVNGWILQLAGTDQTDYALRIHADNLTSANFNGGIEYDKNVRIESGGAFFRAYQTAAHDGDFLSYLTQADAVRFRVDKDGIISAGSGPTTITNSTGQVLQGAVANLGLVMIQTQTVSGVGQVDFTTGLDNTYDSYTLVVSSAKPATDDAEAWLRIGTGGGPTFQTSGYIWGLTANPMGAANTLYGTSAGGSTARIVMSEVGAGVGVGNASGENWSGQVWFNNPEASDFCEVRYDAQYSRATANQSTRISGGGRYDTAGPITGIRFMFSPGNVSGMFTLYGHRKN